MAEVRRRLEHAHKGLAQLELLATSSFGPRGRSKVLTNAHGGAITVTSISHRLVANLWPEDPLARVLLELLSTRQARGADGGLFTVIFATALLRGAAESRMPPRIFTALLPEALTSCAIHLRSGRCAAAAPFRVSSLPCLLALVHAVLSPKRVAVGSASPSELRHVCLLLVQAFVQSIGSSTVDGPPACEPEVSPRPSAPVATAQRLFPGVRMLPLPGRPIGACDLLEGVVLDVPLPPPLEAQRSARPLVVALYDVSLVAAVSDLGARVVLSDAEEDAGDDSAAAGQLFGRFAAALASRGVELLACQKVVPARLQDELTRKGILTLPRLSLRHVGAVRRLSGATPISAMTPPHDGALGRIGGLVDLNIAGKRYLHLLPALQEQPAPDSARTQPASVDGTCGGERRRAHPPSAGLPLATLLLFGPSESATEELEVVASTALNALRATLVGGPPRLVAGGGCVEVLLADHLRSSAPPPLPSAAGDAEGTHTPVGGGAGAAQAAEWRAMLAAAARQRRQVREVFACALESAATALACGGGPSRVQKEEVLDLLRRANTPAVAAAQNGLLGSRALWGWDVDAGAPCEVLRVEATGSAESDSGSASASEDETGAGRGGGASARKPSLAVESAAVVELEKSKLQAMADAVELASALVGIDAVIVDTR
jgi:chaperonin GroEL (HSP60 family)